MSLYCKLVLGPYGIVDFLNEPLSVGVNGVFVINVRQYFVEFAWVVVKEQEGVNYVEGFGRRSFERSCDGVVEGPSVDVWRGCDSKDSNQMLQVCAVEGVISVYEVFVHPQFDARPQIWRHPCSWFEGLSSPFSDGKWNESFFISGHVLILGSLLRSRNDRRCARPDSDVWRF